MCGSTTIQYRFWRTLLVVAGTLVGLAACSDSSVDMEMLERVRQARLKVEDSVRFEGDLRILANDTMAISDGDGDGQVHIEITGDWDCHGEVLVAATDTRVRVHVRGDAQLNCGVEQAGRSLSNAENLTDSRVEIVVDGVINVADGFDPFSHGSFVLVDDPALLLGDAEMSLNASRDDGAASIGLNAAETSGDAPKAVAMTTDLSAKTTRSCPGVAHTFVGQWGYDGRMISASNIGVAQPMIAVRTTCDLYFDNSVIVAPGWTPSSTQLIERDLSDVKARLPSRPNYGALGNRLNGHLLIEGQEGVSGFTLLVETQGTITFAGNNRWTLMDGNDGRDVHVRVAPAISSYAETDSAAWVFGGKGGKGGDAGKLVLRAGRSPIDMSNATLELVFGKAGDGGDAQAEGLAPTYCRGAQGVSVFAQGGSGGSARDELRVQGVTGQQNLNYNLVRAGAPGGAMATGGDGADNCSSGDGARGGHALAIQGVSGAERNQSSTQSVWIRPYDAPAQARAGQGGKGSENYGPSAAGDGGKGGMALVWQSEANTTAVRAVISAQAGAGGECGVGPSSGGQGGEANTYSLGLPTGLHASPNWEHGSLSSLDDAATLLKITAAQDAPDCAAPAPAEFDLVALLPIFEGDQGDTVVYAVDVRLSNPPPAEITVNWATRDDTATAGEDYLAASGTLTFGGAHPASQSIAITVHGDTNTERDEYLLIELSSASAGAVLPPEPLRVKIANDDRPVIVAEGISYVEYAPYASVDIRVEGTHPLGVIDLTYTTVSGSAILGQDFQAHAGILDLSGGIGVIPIPLIDDVISELEEDFFVELSSQSDVQIWNSRVRVGVLDDDKIAQISVAASSVIEDASPVMMTFNIDLSRAQGFPLDVRCYTRPLGGSSPAMAAAIPDHDYTPVDQVIRFTPGDLSKSCLVPVLADDLLEFDESFELVIEDARSGEVLASAFGVIKDIGVVAEASISDAQITESNVEDREMVFMVSLAKAALRDVDIAFETHPLTATEHRAGAVGSDFRRTTGLLRFKANGALRQEIRVPIIGDFDLEPTETFEVRLSAHQGNVRFVRESAIGRIVDNDALRVGVSDARGVEGTPGQPAPTPLRFRVRLSERYEHDLTLAYQTVFQGYTAQSGSDVRATSGFVSIPAGQMEAYVDISTVADVVPESEERFFLAFEKRYPGDDVLAPGRFEIIGGGGTGYITDDDTAALLSISGGQVQEGNSGTSAIPFTISAQPAPAETITVRVRTRDDTATSADNDYVAVDTIVTLDAGLAYSAKTVDVVVNGDAKAELAEQFEVVIDQVTGPAQVSVGSAYGVIENDETLDFGDAPASYPTLAADGGAYHGSVGPLLGVLRDAEPDGQPHPLAFGDDQTGDDDEDGIAFHADLQQGQVSFVDVTVTDGPGLLSAWIDFNGDGDWLDAGEQVFMDEPVSSGTQTLSFTTPLDADDNLVFLRFRLSTIAGLTPGGGASDGEVEDVQMQIFPAAPPVGDIRNGAGVYVCPFDACVNRIELLEDDDDTLIVSGSGSECDAVPSGAAQCQTACDVGVVGEGSDNCFNISATFFGPGGNQTWADALGISVVVTKPDQSLVCSIQCERE